jgi:hypothetical protein
MRRVHVVVGLALLFGAGCAESSGPEARSSAPGPVPASDVAWMDEFCTVVDDLRTGLWGSPVDPGPGDAAALRESLSSGLSGAAEAFGVAVDRLGSLPEDPPAGGSEAVAELDDQLTGLRDSVVTGQEKLAALPPDATEQDLGRVMAEVWPSVASRSGKPLDGVPLTGDMKVAATSPACRSLPGLS